MARARKGAKGKSKTQVSVNFKGVESRRTPPEGDYKCKVLEATNGTSGAGNDQIEFVAEISSGEYKGQKLYLYCPLAENSLWKLHAFLTALGVDVPEDEMDIDLADLIDEEFMGVITHETYNGKKRAKLTDFDSLENYKGEDDDDEDEDDKPKKGKKSKAKSKSDDDDDDDDKPAKGKKAKGKKKPADDDEDDEDEDEKPAKGKKSKSKKPADDEDDDDDDDKPAKGKSKSKDKKSKKKTYDRDEVEDMDEDELQELLEEAGLDDEVDLDDYKKLPKKVAAVIEALEEAELLDD